MVWSAETMLKLREATDPIIGINLDPSHMMILGADPIAAARALKGCIFHVHGKDARIERGLADINGILEPKPVTGMELRCSGMRKRSAVVEGILLSSQYDGL